MLLITFNLSLLACGGGGGSESGTPANNTPSAPNVLSTTPADLATSVARNSAITATFDEDIFATTVDATSFTLNHFDSVFGTVIFNGATNVATFTPGLDLSILQPYNATLNTAITDLDGNPLAADYNWSFTTADGTWQSAAVVETGATSALNPQIDIDINGNAIAVWAQSNGGSVFNIYANRYDASTGMWGMPIEIANELENILDPQIAMDGVGNAIVVWAQTIGVIGNIYANRYDPVTDTWGTKVLISVSTDGYRPQIAVPLATNNAMVVFDSPSAKDVLASEYDSTTSTWGTPEAIDSTVTDSTNAQIAMNFSGDAMVVWASNDAFGVGFGVLMNVYNSTSGNWNAAALTVESTFSNTSAPQVAINDRGHAMVVWESVGSGDIQAKRWDVTNGGPPFDTGLTEVIGSGSGDSDHQIVVDFNGDALAVWTQQDGVFPNFVSNMYSKRYDRATDTWGTASLLETLPGDADAPQITIDSRGNAIAVWQQTNGAGTGIYSSRYVASTGIWGAAELMPSIFTFSNIRPQIAVGSTGVAAAVWQGSDGATSGIHSSNFE